MSCEKVFGHSRPKVIKWERGLESTETEVNIQVEDLDLGHQILTANCSGLNAMCLNDLFQFRAVAVC